MHPSPRFCNTIQNQSFSKNKIKDLPLVNKSIRSIETFCWETLPLPYFKARGFAAASNFQCCGIFLENPNVGIFSPLPAHIRAKCNLGSHSFLTLPINVSRSQQLTSPKIQSRFQPDFCEWSRTMSTVTGVLAYDPAACLHLSFMLMLWVMAARFQQCRI